MTVKVTVWARQIDVEYVSVIARSRKMLVLEIGTVQKYVQVFGYTPTEVLLLATEHTLKETYDPDAMATVVKFPSRRGWEVLPESTGRYTLRVALYKPSRWNKTVFPKGA